MATPNVKGWQAAILRGVGAPVTAENIRFMNAWAQAEGGSAANNPFNTTQSGPGAAGNYNSVGVKNFNSPQAGIAATIATLRNGHYGPILRALGRGNSAMADAQAEAQTPWGTGSLIEKVLGGHVTGGTPTRAGSLAGAMMSGGVQMPQAQNPISALISQVIANNQALQQRQPQLYVPFNA